MNASVKKPINTIKIILISKPVGIIEPPVDLSQQ
jgi:hypothetical protein